MFKKLNIQQESYDVQQKNKRIILYFNLTDSYESLTDLNNLFNKNFTQENQIQFEFELKQESYEIESISLYYFQGFMQENSNDKIDICKLTNIRINLLKLAQQFRKCNIKIILQYNHLQILEKQYQIENHINQLFDGFLTEQKEVILLSRVVRTQQIICYLKQPIFLDYFESDVKEYTLSNKDYIQRDSLLFTCKEFNEEFIYQLHSAKGFFQFEYNDFCSIGVECYLYLRDELEVLSFLILKDIKMLQLNIYELLELPINLKNEKNQDENVKQFLKLLYSLIIRFLQIINKEQFCIQIFVQEIRQAILYWEPHILNHLKYLAQQNPSCISFTKKEKIFLFNYEQIIEWYQSKLLVFQDFTQETLNSFLKKELEMISLQCSLEIKYFDIHLPSKYKLFQEINNFSNRQENIKKPNICLLGLTKTGKSTLLNILMNPNNIKIIKNGQNKYFSIINKTNDIIISQSCKSQTKQTYDREINDFIFTDTPGFQDTNSENRLINQIKIFTQLQRSPQIIFLILIDGQKLCENINDLYSTIKHINLFFGDQLIESQLEKFIIPVFNKLGLNTMEQIKNILEKEIESDYPNSQLYHFLKAIKNRIDNNGYIELLNASYFMNKQEIKNLKKQIQETQNQITNLLRDNKINSNEISQLNERVILLQNEIDIKGNKINYDLLEKIQQQILNQCKNLSQEQTQQKQKIKFTLSLNAEMKEHYNTILKYQDEICTFLLRLITDVIINNLLNDHSRNLDQVTDLCSQIQNIIQDFKSNENISIYDFFISLSQKFINLFQNQILIQDLIKKLNSIYNISKFIQNGQAVKKISSQYLENELDLVRRSCINLHNNQNFQNFLTIKKFKEIQIFLLKLIQLDKRAERLKQSTKQQYERLKMEILKIEYDEIKKSQK
ncbi:unnamed protein product [Paramecium primaurelia]|uniref:G domain-containing protein n=1 Tax=Paramecium primaurelia TaxID=5886 RepID=A0A8S1P7A9_PARPR|nr:unnamed protein product [Paramecium primaurelia]